MHKKLCGRYSLQHRTTLLYHVQTFVVALIAAGPSLIKIPSVWQHMLFDSVYTSFYINRVFCRCALFIKSFL